VINKVEFSEYSAMLNIINEAAHAYKGVIPADCWKEPYMSADELIEDIDFGVDFYGYREESKLVGVMGMQHVKDTTLIRHAYVHPSYQRKGIGEKLLVYLLNLAQTSEVLVGTWTDAWWAIRFYEKQGFKLVVDKSQSMLDKYWTIPGRQAENSIVLRFNK